MKKTIKAWAGFCEGKIDITQEIYSGRSMPAIYKKRYEAITYYEDVRPVAITYEVPKKK